MFRIMIYETNNVTVFANSKGEGKPPKSVCVEEFKEKWKEFDNNQEIFLSL
jgi:hypothetical protein